LIRFETVIYKDASPTGFGSFLPGKRRIRGGLFRVLAIYAAPMELEPII
jgi:hypothetical protein